MIGKIKENSLKQLIGEYLKRLGSYCQIEVFEGDDEKAPEKLSLLQQRSIKDEEGKRLLRNITNNDFVIALTLDGKTLTSEEFSQKLSLLQVDGVSSIAFVIGGSLGLGEEVVKRANFKLSLSKMTFPHQLARLIITEQIYRAFKISHNEPYHK